MLIARPATMSTADQRPKSLSAAMRCFRPANDVQCHRLVSVAAEAADLKIEISSVQSAAEARRGLSRSFETQHVLVPGDTRQTVSFLPSLGRALRRIPNRTAANALARFGSHQGK